jgi:hypothetical protein
LPICDRQTYGSAQERLHNDVSEYGVSECRSATIAICAPRAGAFCAGRRVMDKIHIAGLEKTYASKGGRVTALTQINLTIRQNEFITLVGSS